MTHIAFKKQMAEIERLRANPPAWALTCPVSYAAYLDAHATAAVAVQQQDIEAMAAAMRDAWIAGQNSVTEKS